MRNTSYVLVSAAYNEAKNIARTIKSVLGQTFLPKEWIIVSDGSTDDTDAIIISFSEQVSFLRYIRVNRDPTHSFGAKVHAINRGRAELSTKDYGFFGILDTDISFEPFYFETMIGNFDHDPLLGIAGGNIVQYIDGELERRIKSLNSVAGAVQLFKRECFLSTDGFSPMEFGGEDAAIEIEARMNGWRVRTFPEIEVIHYGYVGMGSGSRLKARLKYGKMCYMLGYHPFFQIMRLLMRIIEKPFLVGSIAELSGFVRAKCEFKKPALKPDVVHFLRREQLGRLFSTAKRKSVGINT